VQAAMLLTAAQCYKLQWRCIVTGAP